ncbi:MAG: AI-2E family transporter [Actinomycetota bacterium]|nr:AI-2E family transporter [Actinomycetota bacterium]
MAETARRTAIATLVAGSIVVLALALWKLKLILSLVLLGFIIAAAMRPGVEALHRRRIPRAAGILINYAVIVGAVALFLSLVVPRAVTQIRTAVGELPTTPGELDEAARGSTGIEHDILVGLQRRLEDLPSASEVAGQGVELTVAAFEVMVGIFFVLATAAYWIFERDRAVDLVCRLLPRPRRKLVRDTWTLIDLKLGAYVRGQAVLIVLVGTVLSIIFMAIGLPYWILIGAFAGVVEIIPVIGPLAAGALAIGVGLTESLGVAAAAGIAVLVVRLLEDYLILPRVLGEAVGLSPLLVLVSVTSVAILFGAFAVILAVPIAALVATLVDVILLNKNPAEEDVPAVIFPAKEAETS